MSKIFTFSKLAKLGEMDEKYGQRYWGETNEQLMPVSFNSMNEDITAEDTIEAEEVLLKESKKGTEYHQLKKVKVVQGVTGAVGSDKPVQLSASPSQLDRIEDKLDRLLNAATENIIKQEDVDNLPIFERTEND